MRSLAPALAAVLALSAAACPPAPPAATHRVVMVFDPTVSPGEPERIMDGEVRRLGDAVRALPPDTRLDLYFVGAAGLQGQAALRDSLPFDPVRGMAAHEPLADSLAARVEALAAARVREARGSDRRPSSCIITALRQTRESLAPRGEPERVAVVVFSDLLEACDHYGRINLETSLPAAMPDVPQAPDYRGVEAVHLVTRNHARVGNAGRAERIRLLWVELLGRWGAPAERVHQRGGFPQPLFGDAPPASDSVSAG